MNEKIEALKSSFDSELKKIANMVDLDCLLYTSPSPRD